MVEMKAKGRVTALKRGTTAKGSWSNFRLECATDGDRRIKLMSFCFGNVADKLNEVAENDTITVALMPRLQKTPNGTYAVNFEVIDYLGREETNSADESFSDFKLPFDV